MLARPGDLVVFKREVGAWADPDNDLPDEPDMRQGDVAMMIGLRQGMMTIMRLGGEITHIYGSPSEIAVFLRPELRAS